jgi:hypothetical protein
MNDYLNHKWRKFVNEDKKPARRPVLRENTSPSQSDRKAKSIPFPKLRISEEWGKPRSGDRSAIRTFARKVKGENLEQKIESIDSFISDCKAACIKSRGTPEMISNLVLLDALSAIIYDYNASAGGFLFEGFISMLLGGQSRQVQAGAGGIEDIITNKGEKLSLKFFKEGGSKAVGGSLGDLRDSVEAGKPMKYLVVLKATGAQTVTQINFYEFTVGTNGRAYRVSQKPTKYVDPETQEVNPEYQKTGYIYPKEEPIPGDFIAEDYTKGIAGVSGIPTLKKAPHFEIPVSQVIKKITPYDLKFGGPKFMRNLANTYVDLIGNDVAVIYEDLESLSTNLTSYFVDEDMAAGEKASRVAGEMPAKITKLMIKKPIQ